jgi:hypothetical protein
MRAKSTQTRRTKRPRSLRTCCFLDLDRLFRCHFYRLISVRGRKLNLTWVGSWSSRIAFGLFISIFFLSNRDSIHWINKRCSFLLQVVDVWWWIDSLTLNGSHVDNTTRQELKKVDAAALVPATAMCYAMVGGEQPTRKKHTTSPQGHGWSWPRE